MSEFPPALLLILGAGLLLLPLRRADRVIFLGVSGLAFVLLVMAEPGTRVSVPFLDYELVIYRVDRLSLAFGYVFTLFTLLAGIYGLYSRDRAERTAALLYAGGALGVTFAGDLFTLFIFWELMAVSSVYLIWARREPEAERAGMRYLLVHLFGGSVLMAGILTHLASTGSIEFSALGESTAGYLILFGFALNAAVPPLHAWLPDAYPQGTVTGTVFLSAFTTKTAVYVLARGFAGWEILVWFGVAMALYGVVFAVLENDIRRLLAYHIISQVGYMVTGVGLGTETALNGVTAHAFAHILYKGLLLMGAGTVLYTTGRSKLTELGGLASRMPWTFWLYMIGAFSISGFPLFSGFVSKSMVIYAAEIEHWETVVLLLHLASVGTFLHTGLKLPYFTWLGPRRKLDPAPVPGSMYAGMALAAAINIAIGLYPAFLYNLLPFAVDYEPYTGAHLLETVQLLLFTGLGFWLLVGKLGGEATITLDTDWSYRRFALAAYRFFPLALSRLFTAVESYALELVRWVSRISMNPVGYLIILATSWRDRDPSTPKPVWHDQPFDPDRYRLPLGLILLVVLICFLAVLALDLLAIR